MLRVHGFTLLGGVAFLAACEAAEPSRMLTTVRDSAGIQIVETSAESRFNSPFSLGDTPIWAVGEVEGDQAYLLSRVAGAMQLPTGEIVVGNGGTNEIRFYGPDGALWRSRGGEGQGPGEFEYLRALGRCRVDGFIAFDLNWQMNAYSLDGTFLEKTTLRTPSGITPYELTCDAHGHVLMLGWGREASEGPREGFYQAYDHLLLTTPEGSIETDFGVKLTSERIGSRYGSSPHPAGRATVFALHDDQVLAGSGERFEVQVFGLDGSLRSLLRGPPASLEVTDSVRELILQRRLDGAPADRHPEIRSDFANWEWPESLPAFTDLRVDSEGVVWVLAFSADPSAPEVWSLLDLERGYLGDISLRPGQSLLEAGLDYVLLLTEDELDVERVEKYPLNRTPVARP